MNKKTKQAVIVLIITILLLGCGSLGIVGAEKYEENHNASSVSQESREQASNSDSSQSETQDDNAQESTDSKSNDADTSNGKNTNPSSSNKTGSGASDKQGNSASSSGSGSSSGSSSNSGSSSYGSSGNATAKPSQKPQQGTNTDNKKTYNCTVTIDCSVILNNMGNLTDGKEAYVPSNGYILKDYSLKAKQGESVYSLLKRACDENNIPLNATDSGFGKYVYGINNLDQKDCGSESGWKYSVNGVYPGRSCDAEKIKSNTKIVWKYVIHVNDT